jgi:hypothetical protein
MPMKLLTDWTVLRPHEPVDLSVADSIRGATILAWVISRTLTTLTLELSAAAWDSLPPGSLVQLERRNRTHLRGQVVEFTPRGRSILVLRALDAPVALVNQRATERTLVQWRETTLRYGMGEERHSVRARIIDVSSEGLCLVMPRLPGLGERVQLALPAAFRDTLSGWVTAEVTWTRPLRRTWQVGLHFIDLPAPVRAYLADRVHQRVPAYRRDLAR